MDSDTGGAHRVAAAFMLSRREGGGHAGGRLAWSEPDR